MLFYMIVLYILIKATFAKANAGTTIFRNRHAWTGCWNDDDIVKLSARKAFEELMPHVNPDELDVKYIKNVLRYYRKALHSVDQDSNPHTFILLKEAIADTVGAHLRSEMLPAVRFAYYAGYVPFRNARQLHDFYDEIKIFLNTQGLGWKKPKRASQKWSNLTVAKILIGAGTFFDPCSCLITKRDSNSCIHFPIPKYDDDSDPAALALPFKSGGLVSLVAPGSNNILLKYYTTASRCILSSSPEKCRHSDFVSFNNELWHWMKRDVAPHLIDEKLYAAYGGVFRVAAAVQNYGKGLTRRNLFSYAGVDEPTWNPWKILSQSFITVDLDWTPTLYVGVVVMTAISIYLVQICYSYICGVSRGCYSKEDNASLERRSYSSSSCASKCVKFVNADRNVSNVMPAHQSPVYYSDAKRVYQPASKTRSASLGSIRTQKVYDLNDNKEKLMAVIMSDNGSMTAESSPSQSSVVWADESVVDVDQGQKRSKSPPKLQTSMSELTVNRTARGSQPVYSNSTMTQTLTGSCRARGSSDSSSSSASSSSDRINSSTSSKSRRSRSSRNLAWARRVISKHALRSGSKSTSRTELNLNSYTSPTS